MGSIREFISSIANPAADSTAQGASDQKPTIAVSANGDGSFVFGRKWQGRDDSLPGS
jgi:hypothetical protein